MKRIFSFGALLFFTTNVYAVSFKEALNTALTNNPKPKSKDLQILAMKNLTTAAWLGFLPTLSATCGYTHDTNTTVIQGYVLPSNAKETACSAAIALNLFDGGVTYYGAKSAEDAQKAQEAIFNSTNPLVENTKGVLANSLMVAYSSILLYRDEIDAIKMPVALLKKAIAATKDPEDITHYKSSLDSYETVVDSLTDKMKSNKEDYAYIVTQSSETFDSFDDAIKSLEIPATPGEAINEAKMYSPDLKRRVYELGVAEYAVKIARARAIMPKIVFTIAKGYTNIADRSDPFNNLRVNGDLSFGLSFTWSISASSIPTHLATKYELKSAQLEQQAAIDDLQHSLNKTYLSYESSVHSDTSYQRHSEAAKAKLEDDSVRIDRHEYMKREDLLRDIQDFQNSIDNLLGNKQGILFYKFAVQQTAGTVFQHAAD